MKKCIIFSGIALLVLTSCRKRLDSFLFNNAELTEYKLDNYSGEVALEVGNDYAVPVGAIHQFALEMDVEGVNEEIHMVYAGDLSTINQDTVILYCHGNRDHMDYYWPRQKLLANVGGLNRFGVLMMDYPGYGMSGGAPTEENMYQSVALAMQWLKDQGVTSQKLIMCGYSLGSAAACELTANKADYPLEPTKLILESPFASAEVMVQDAAALDMPGSYFVNLKIDNAEEIKKVDIPLLWIHGTDDDFLSIKTHGELVYANKSGDKTAIRVEGGDHNNPPAIMGYENYIKALEDFITN